MIKTQQIYSLDHLAVLTISGKDAASFLQGQITCNVHDVTATQSSLAAMCNPKGRTIAVFLLTKAEDSFYLVLPKELLTTVKERLQKYVLRAAVKLVDSTEALCLFGISDIEHTEFLATQTEDAVVRIHYADRCLLIMPADKAATVWQDYLTQGFQDSDAAHWRYLDIKAGIPWLTLATSEQFIPQTLNLDKLGAISLTKGCYTGQEIVARTHYLGKAKRTLFLAECSTENPAANAGIIDADGQVIGHVLSAENHKMLIVLQNTDTAQLRLKDYNQAFLTLLS